MSPISPVDERRIQSIVAEVLGRLETDRAGGNAAAEPLGVHADLESAISAGIAAFRAFDATPLNARKVSTLTVDLMNRAAKRAGAPMPLFHTVAQPTLETAQGLLRDRRIRLNVVTGGPGVVKEALAAGKKAITAGPGNPPAVVDETADLEKAARDVTFGASLDNNIVCTDEKEVIAVALIADRLKEAFARAP